MKYYKSTDHLSRLALNLSLTFSRFPLQNESKIFWGDNAYFKIFTESLGVFAALKKSHLTLAK